MEIKIRATQIKLVDPKTLKPHPKNPNNHPKEQISLLMKIFKYQGMRRPLTVSNQTGFVTVGCGRLEAAIEAGMALVPVIYQDYDSSDQEYADVVADNSLGLQAELNTAAVNFEVGKLSKDFDVAMLALPVFKADDADLPDLPDGDRDGMGQIAFKLTPDQQDAVKRALAIAKKMGDFGDTGSSNSNGNAIARICEVFTTQNQEIET